MPRSSRHKSSHKSHRRSSPVDWSGSDEERESEPRVSRDSESDKRKSSHSKELKESTNGYASADHGKKRKDRIESKDESGASDRWDSGLGRDGDDDALVEKRSKADACSTVDTEKERDKEKHLKEESKSRSSRRHDERSEEKRRYKEEKEREKEREREKEKGREKEKEKEKEKEREKEKESDRDREREREKDRDRDRERSKRREKYEEDKREKERYEGDRREKERYEEEKREKERYEEDKREKHRYEEVKREKDRYDEDKREKVRHDDAVASTKRESETSRIEEGNSANKDVDIITEGDATEREQHEKHSKRRRDETSPEEKDREREREKKEREREREKEKERHRDDHSKSRSSKEQKSETDKYKDKHRDRDRDRDDRKEREYYEYKSTREGNRSSESRYKKSKGSEADPYDYRDEYSTKHKDGHVSKRGYEATEDRHEQDVEREDVERSRGEYRYGDKEKEKEMVDSSPGKIRLKGSPGSSSYHDRDQNRHRSKPIESPKKEPMQEERHRARTAFTGERTSSRLRDEKLNRPRDDAHSLELSSEIASSTPRSETHASPKFAPERSPSNTGHKYSSSRGGSDSSKYRDRDKDRERESDVPMPDKLMISKREPTPIGTSNRSNSTSGFAPLPYEDGDNRRESGPERRFHKRGGHAHGNNSWNGAPNWASQVNNGFMPLPPGPPPPSGFHHFAAPPPPLFGMRPPPLKLGPSGVGVSFPVHDPMDRFSGHMRGPYGWHNTGGSNPFVEDSFPPNLWGPAGNGVFGAEPFWDQNRPLPTWKAQGEIPNKELISVSHKEMGAPPPAIKMEEQSISENLPSETVDLLKDESVKAKSSVETSVKIQKLHEVTAEVDKRQEASVKVGNFWESYIPRIGISRDLVDSEMYKKCTALGELEENIGVSDMPQAGVMEGKEKRNGMSVIVLKSLFPIKNDEIFKKAMSLYNKLADRQKPPGNNDLLGAPDLEKSKVNNQAEVSNMQLEVPATDNISLVGVTPDLVNEMEVDEKVSSNFVSDSDSIIFKNVAEECEPVIKESNEDGLSRIPISTENTH